MPEFRPVRLTRDARHLISLIESLTHSASRLEDTYWESLLDEQLSKLLRGRKNSTVETVLEQLSQVNGPAYELLIEQAEAASESLTLSLNGADFDVLLFSAPIVAWTRYQLPGSEIRTADLEALQNALVRTTLAEGAQLALLPGLLCFDQMPQSFHETSQWTRQLGTSAMQGQAAKLRPGNGPSPDNMLADARFLIGAVAAPKGRPLFRWQDESGQAQALRLAGLEDWKREATTILSPLFTGCTLELLQVDAFYSSSREADRRIRPLALRAAVTWLQDATNTSGAELRAIIAACGETGVEEYRVGFTPRQGSDLIYGCVWPVLSKEEALAATLDGDEVDTPDEIAALLKELGVNEIRRLPGIYPAEFCDDCGAPYFPNAMGEMLHPELPEETDLTPAHFH